MKKIVKKGWIADDLKLKTVMEYIYDEVVCKTKMEFLDNFPDEEGRKPCKVHITIEKV